MEDKYRVFIRGVEGRGDEVIKMLTDLGAVNGGHCEGEYPSTLYYINHDGVVDYTFPGTEEGQIIMDNYRELHLPEKWKDEDILVSRSNSQVMALYEFVSDKDADLFNAYFRIDDNMIFSHSLEVRDRFRLATDQEIERFYDLLHIHHKDWDSENKRLVDWRWEPKEGDSYYIIDNDGEIVCDTWDGYQVDANYYNFGNCFRTREDAEGMLKKIKKLLKGEQL